jgi:hypothetical protein
VNLGASYNYNVYSDFDHVTNNYHDGGSLYSNFNLTYTPTRLMTEVRCIPISISRIHPPASGISPGACC